MRENRTHGSEGGESGSTGLPYPYLEIRVDQTDLDYSKSIEVNGVKIPGFNTRMFDTVLELQAGETAMLRNKQLLVIVTPEFVASLAKTVIPSQPPQRVHEIPVKAGMDISMVLGQSVILKFENKIPELRVGDESIIQAQPTAPNRVRVTAKRAGWTVLTSLDEAGKSQEIPIDVVAPRLPAPPTAAVKRPTGPATIIMTALVYTLDPKKVQDDGLDVSRTLLESAAPAEIVVSAPQPESLQTIVSVLGPRTVVTLTQRLSQTKGAEVLSRLQIMAISGQTGRVEIGSRVQLPSSGDVQQASGRFQDVGLVLEVVPIVRGDRIHLEARVKHSQLKDETVESISLFGVAELYPGETLAICQNDKGNDQLLLLLTPKIFDQGARAQSPSKTSRLHPLPEQKTVAAQRTQTEAKLNSLKTHFGPTHPQVLQQQQQLASLNQYLAQQTQSDAQKPNPRQDFDKTIHQLFPDAKITLHPLPDGIVISGTVSDAQQVELLVNIAKKYFPDVHSNLKVARQRANIWENATAKPRDLQAVLDELFPDKTIKTYPLNSSVVLIGTADPTTVEQVIRIAEDFYPSVINHLSEAVTSPPTTRNGPREAKDEVAGDGLQNQLRELRQDVKVLRGSVNQLIDLLQKQVDETPTQEPSSIDSQSSNTPAKKSGALMWQKIGIRAEPTEVTGSRYRGGLKILDVRRDSPAARQGMRQGDVLVGLDKWETLEDENLVYVLDRLKENNRDRMKFYLLRGNETLFGHLKFAPPPKPNHDADKQNEIGSDVSEPTTIWKLSLDAVIEIALQNSKSIRNLGALTLGADTLGPGSELIVSTVNADMDLNQFEAAVRQVVSNVEEAYWDLWVADREVETYKTARDTAQKLWTELNVKRSGDENSRLEVELREAYFACRSQVEASLKKLYDSEKALRQLIGLASSDGRLIQATDQPTTSPLKVISKDTLAKALAKTPELRRQRQSIRSIELQLTAAKKPVLPTNYTFSGAATIELLTDNQLSFGNRRNQALIRNLELRLLVEKARLEEMQANISVLVTESIRRLELAFASLQRHANRWQAAQNEAESEAKTIRQGGTDLNRLLAANRRSCQSALDSDHATRLYVIAIRDLRILQGSWLKNRDVRIVEAESAASGQSSGEDVGQATASESQHGASTSN